MKLFKRRFSILRIIIGIIVAGICLFLLLRGQINYNIVN